MCILCMDAFQGSFGQTAKTSAFHVEDTGSIPVRNRFEGIEISLESDQM